jgi:hypothetical protein
MALEMELWPRSDWDMVSESSTDAVEVLLAVVFFLGSASRGSSWQRWPIFRLMHLVHGRSCPRH